MTPLALVAAVTAAVAVWAAAHAVARPRRPIGARVSPYTAVARARLGAPPTPDVEPVLLGEAARRILGPLATELGNRLAGGLRVTPDKDLDLKLRRAGRPMTAAEFRRKHLRFVVAAPLAFAFAAVAEHRSTTTAVVFAALGLFFGARYLPDKIDRAIARRSREIRSDLYSVAQLLAIRAQGKEPLIGAIQGLVRTGTGPVVDDLGAALALIAEGYGAAAAFTRLADEAAEPQAAHFYRLLTTATKGTADLPANLLELAANLRTQRREQIQRRMTRRFAAQVLPILGIMAPVMLIFVAAPIPRAIFGS